MRKILFIFSLCFACSQLFTAAAQTPWERERKQMRSGILGVSDILGVKEKASQSAVRLYGESHALVIGMSDYRDPEWNDLSGVVSDVKEVSETLDEHGFQVEVVMNLTGLELMSRLEQFVGSYGADEQNRLLIYYAGHGYKTKSGTGGREDGFIVPVDAPSPEDKAFAAMAVNMSRIMSLAAKIKSKHALLVLDSCFSGTLINAAQPLAETARASNAAREPLTIERAGRLAVDFTPQPHNLPPIPYPISTNAEERAHLFITSGTDKQLVDDNSEFRRKFVQALVDESGAGADMNGDSYVTGEELGSYLYRNVTENSLGRQRPRQGFIGGRINNPGDFLFVLPGAYAREMMVGPALDPGLWNLPSGWTFIKEKGKDRLLAEGRGLALPKDLLRHSFHDFAFVTRLSLTNNSAANFVLRAQGPQDYYLIRISGNNAPDKEEKFTVRAFAVRGGARAELIGSPLRINHPDVEQRVNREGLIQVEVIVENNQFTVNLSAAEGNGRGFPLINPLEFIDDKKSFRYGAAGYLVEDKERFKIEIIHMAKLQKKGQV